MRGLVALGGALGSVARVALTDALPTPGGWPAATLLVNVSGALLLGVLLSRTSDPRLRAVLGTGVLGAWTTFSALAVEVDGLLRTDVTLGLAYVAVSVTAGLLAATLGRRAAGQETR